jgi:NlpC/P60 family putative phage cell wall peptidase
VSRSRAEAVVELARAWLGTPYCHRASVRGVGCDCLGLLVGVLRDLPGAAPVSVPVYRAGWAEFDVGERLWQALRRHLSEVPPDGDLHEGQVLLFRMREGVAARHTGILTGTKVGGGARFIHAYERHGVIESPLSLPWKRRVVARFELI